LISFRSFQLERRLEEDGLPFEEEALCADGGAPAFRDPELAEEDDDAEGELGEEEEAEGGTRWPVGLGTAEVLTGGGRCRSVPLVNVDVDSVG